MNTMDPSCLKLCRESIEKEKDEVSDICKWQDIFSNMRLLDCVKPLLMGHPAYYGKGKATGKKGKSHAWDFPIIVPRFPVMLILPRKGMAGSKDVRGTSQRDRLPSGGLARL